MKRPIILSFAVVIFLGGSTSAFAQQVYSDICWTVNGFPVNTSLTLAGNVGSTYIFDVDGFGTSTGVPIKGTLTWPTTGDLPFSFLIQAASPTQYAVVHELSLSRNTLNGTTGNWRWFDSEGSGTSTATFVACGTAASSTSEDPASEGIR